MPDLETIIAIINLFGAANGMLIGVVLILLHGQPRPTMYLGLLLLCASVTLALITLEHALWLPSHWMVYAGEEWLSLLAGCLLLGFVIHTTRGRHPPTWIYAPLALYPLLAALSKPGFIGMEYVMWGQIAYTLAAMGIYFRSTSGQTKKARQPLRPVALLITVMVLIHLAQLGRLIMGDQPLWRDIVPITGTVFFYLLLFYALLHSRLLHKAIPLQRSIAEHTRHDFETLDARVRAAQLFLDPELDLNALALQVELPPHRVSEAINAVAGLPFYDYLAELRIEAAKDLLSDPEERRYTIEGIARQCGFKSRSVFYRQFKAVTGQTPAEWRAARR